VDVDDEKPLSKRLVGVDTELVLFTVSTPGSKARSSQKLRLCAINEHDMTLWIRAISGEISRDFLLATEDDVSELEDQMTSRTLSSDMSKRDTFLDEEYQKKLKVLFQTKVANSDDPSDSREDLWELPKPQVQQQ